LVSCFALVSSAGNKLAKEEEYYGPKRRAPAN